MPQQPLDKVLKSTLKSAKKAVKDRYVTKTGKGLRMSQVLKDVALLKSMVNAEKKRVVYKSIASSPPFVGQVNGNSSGHFVLDITPNVAEGVTNSTRNGSSFRWTSSYLEFMFNRQDNYNGTQKFLIEVWKVNNQPYTQAQISGGQFIADLFTPNEYITSSTGTAVNIYDMIASRDQDTFKNFKRVAFKYVSFPAQQISGTTAIKQVKMGLKLGHHVKFQDDTTIVTSGQLILTIRADVGNTSMSVASTHNGVPVKVINSGCSLQYAHTHYFYDN